MKHLIALLILSTAVLGGIKEAKRSHQSKLKHICRYGGRCNRFFSIAQHSLLVRQILEDSGCSKQVVLGGLSHDFSEAYLTDIIRPVKMMIPGIVELESSIIDAIAEVMPIGEYDHELVHNADNIALFHEAYHLGFNAESWGFSDEISHSELSDEANSVMVEAMTPFCGQHKLSTSYKHQQEESKQ